MRSVEYKGFVEEVKELLLSGEKVSRSETERIAKRFEITNKTEIKELVELAIVKAARFIASRFNTEEERFFELVKLYERQPNLSHRNSTSVALNQYSTAVPIAYLMGIYTRFDHNYRYLFEPSAGNGALTIAGNPLRAVVNEIDDFRAENLRYDFRVVRQMDATQTFPDTYTRAYNVVMMNPPFGLLPKPVEYEGYKIKSLDHLMVLRALETLKDDGKAAILIGGHTKYDSQGRVKRGEGRFFLNYLYRHFYVDDVIFIDGSKLYGKQGTSFDLRLILINGRKSVPSGAPYLKDVANLNVIGSFYDLFKRVQKALQVYELTLEEELERWADEMIESHEGDQELNAPYIPTSQACKVLNTETPDSLAFEMHQAVERIKEDVGGDIDNFVRHRLGYHTKIQLCKVLSAEQIDAVAMAIYNIEGLGQAVIIGDQTGIGKGRVAASIIRYAHKQGLHPVFLTEKPNLFSDIYRDLKAIGSGHLRPFIVNTKESKTQIKDSNGKVIYTAPRKAEQEGIIKDQSLPEEFDFIVATYSQFNSPKKPIKRGFLLSQVRGNILIMDESHNASGASHTGEFLQEVIERTKGTVFLSATFAKRPENMPIYAIKTSISQANMTNENLVNAISQGGVALQEILASQLVAEGQMIRRERSYEGVQVDYLTLTEHAPQHKAVADNITDIIRDIIAFQKTYINTLVNDLDELLAEESEEADLKQGTEKAGVDNMPYFSKVFNIINQMLFSIKAEAVADRAIQHLQQGKKPIIAFSSTMGSFLDSMENEHGDSVTIGDQVSADFAIVLEKGLRGVMRYTETRYTGKREHKEFSVYELSPDGQTEYFRIMEKIQKISTGISISPIDVIIEKLQEAGYRVAEVTGRKQKLQLNKDGSKGILQTRKKINTNDAFRQFNDNEVDVMLLNQSGAVGASAHAVVTDKVAAHEVKQRVMLVLQAELDISKEVQKRGRVYRTGQILLPIFEYISSVIPAEQRLMMMLQKKLKSLDANTSSNQKQSTGILNVPDFLNKYGDHVVREYLLENPQVTMLLDNPLKGTGDGQVSVAHKVSGRVAVLSTKMQTEFYEDVTKRYDALVEYLKQTDDYDLEVEELPLQAKTLSASILKAGQGGNTSFGADSILEKCEVNNLRKPFKTIELENLINQSIGDKTPTAAKHWLIKQHQLSYKQKLNDHIQELEDRYDLKIRNVEFDPVVLKAQEKGKPLDLEKRVAELEKAKQNAIKSHKKAADNKNGYMEALFNFFKIGNAYSIPSFDSTDKYDLDLAVFLGFHIDLDSNNPFAPSSVRLRFAVASSTKYIAIPASRNHMLHAIVAVSKEIEQKPLKELLQDWETAIQNKSQDRIIRHIVTGNIIQAYSMVSGKLVSYSTLDGESKKGILLPASWDAVEALGGKVAIPALVAQKIIGTMAVGAMMEASHQMSIIRLNDTQFRLLVPASKKQGGVIYLHEPLLALVINKNFEKSGTSMKADFQAFNLIPILEVLQKMGVSVRVAQSLVESVGLIYSYNGQRIKISPPPNEQEIDLKMLRLQMEMEAEAMMIELELTELKNKAA